MCLVQKAAVGDVGHKRMDDNGRVEVISPIANRQKLPGDFDGVVMGAGVTAATAKFNLPIPVGTGQGTDIPRW